MTMNHSKSILLSSLFLWLILSPVCFVEARSRSRSQPHSQSSSSSNNNPIEHVVVIMYENRSFDNLLGWLHLEHKSIDGLDGTQFNLVNASDASSQRVYVNQHGYDEGPDDPNHDFNATTEEIFGYYKPVNVTAKPMMNGFVQNAYESDHNITNVMSMFTRRLNSAPVINTLATEFAVFDRWYCSLPGPTDPNRAYVMSGTSNGMTTNFNGTLWTQQSYFDFLRVHNKTWRAYYQDDPWAIMYFNDTHWPENQQNIHLLDRFFVDLENNQLAQYTFLQPRMTSTYGPPTWQHPDSSVREGERLLKQIYEALRVSKFWHKLAFIVTYDEHGGFFDHVPPPQSGIPSPDGVLSPEGFNFDRLGIRIPTLVISPWINRATVVHEPTNGPTSTSQFESTSIMSTVNKLFGITDHMTQRDKWSATFEWLFTQRTSPRTDCPMSMPELPPYKHEQLLRQRARVLNDHMKIQIDFYCKFNHHDLDACGKNIHNQGEASDFIVREASRFMQRLASAKPHHRHHQ